MLPAKLGGRQSRFLLFDHPDDLCLGETALPHVVCSFRLGRLYITARELPGGRSPPLAVDDPHTDRRMAQGIDRMRYARYASVFSHINREVASSISQKIKTLSLVLAKDYSYQEKISLHCVTILGRES